MATQKLPLKRRHNECSPRPNPSDSVLPDVAFAAIVSSKKQKEVTEFIAFILAALDRNSNWLNVIVGKQQTFRCALLVGSGPNRFNLQEIIYPSKDDQIKLEVELVESEDYDKIAIAALCKMTNANLQHSIDFLRNRLHENRQLKEDMLTGKDMGVQFAVLNPITDKQYRIMERIVISNTSKITPEKTLHYGPRSKEPLKKFKRYV